MSLTWTAAARERLLPFPGEAWSLTGDLNKAAKAVAKASSALPERLDREVEIARGIALRLHCRYTAQGNLPKDKLGRDLVDLWCARSGVVFATEVLIALAKSDRPDPSGGTTAYELRRDGHPWARLREQLAVAPKEDRARAEALAAGARGSKGELDFALSYAFCNDAWVEADLEPALEKGWGALAVIAAVRNAPEARSTLERLIAGDSAFQLIEEAVWHMPSLMSRLGPSGASLVVRAARLAWNKATRKPWLEWVACYSTAEAKKYLAEYQRP